MTIDAESDFNLDGDPAEGMPPSEFMADQDGERLDVFLARRFPGLSRSGARRQIDKGLAQVEGEVSRASQRLRFGDVVRVWPEQPAGPVAKAESIPIDVRYEDADLIVISKAVGLTVHPAPGEPTGTLVNALLAHCPDLQAIGDAIRPGIVHRLDKNTSGVMMVAKNAASLHHLQDQIRERSVEKRYWAVVAGIPQPESGRIDAPIGRDRLDPRRMTIVQNGKASQTEYEVVERFADSSLLECRLITGRTHQIRVHLAAQGHPIVGDVIYGIESDLIDRQALHARVLAFDHPTSGERMRVTVEPPEDFQELLRRLREGALLHGSALFSVDAVAAPAQSADRRSRKWKPSRHRSRRIR